MDIRVVTLRGRVSFWDHFIRGSVIILRDVLRISCIFSFLSILDTLILVHEALYVFLSLTPSCVISFLSLYTCFLFICMQSYYSVSHKDALMSFV